MDDLISREMAIKEAYKIVIDGDAYEVVQVETLMGLPSVDAVEVRHGRWIEKDSGIEMCSVCGGEPYYSGNIHEYKYCPYCGARMDGET